jgi:hypothetical protein
MSMGFLIALVAGVGITNIFCGRIQFGTWKDGVAVGIISAVLCFLAGLLIVSFS